MHILFSNAAPPQPSCWTLRPERLRAALTHDVRAHIGRPWPQLARFFVGEELLLRDLAADAVGEFVRQAGGAKNARNGGHERARRTVPWPARAFPVHDKVLVALVATGRP